MDTEIPQLQAYLRSDNAHFVAQPTDPMFVSIEVLRVVINA